MQQDKIGLFIKLFFLMAISQTIVLTVIPLKAYSLLGSVKSVSVLYVIVGLAGVVGRLIVPLLIRILSRPYVLILGTLASVTATISLSMETVANLMCGLLLQVFGLACVEIVLTLAMLEHIPRSRLTRFEARRLFVSAIPFTLCPWLGVYLKANLAEWVPFAVQGTASILLLICFLLQSSSGSDTRPEATSRNFRGFVRQFFSQPRLRLAWILASCRSAWWVMFFVYSPIFAVSGGLGEQVGALVVSAGTFWMWAIPVWGWVGQRVGLRWLLVAAYSGSALFTITAGALMHVAPVAAIMLVLAALTTVAIDAAGNSLFLRAVRSYERSEMTALFVTYRDVAQLAAPAIFSVLLTFFSLPAVFFVGGAMMVVAARIARHIPQTFK